MVRRCRLYLSAMMEETAEANVCIHCLLTEEDNESSSVSNRLNSQWFIGLA